MPEQSEEPWGVFSLTSASNFALRCAELSRQEGHPTEPLRDIMTTLMTELWDRNFSQSEIRDAFAAAVGHLPRYAAGEERRSSVSSEPFTHF